MVAVPGIVSLAALGVLMAQGAMAASFAVSGSHFKVGSGRLSSSGLASYVDVDRSADGSRHPVSLLALKDVSLTDICQSTRIKTPIGTMVFRLTAGGEAGPVTADSLVIDGDDLTGDAQFGTAQIGRDASTLDAVPGVKGEPGHFGLQVKGVDVAGVKSRAWSAMGGNFKLKGMKISVGPGGKECF
ncbi:cholesterol esterase [Streptomyces sp. YC537]|uniref:Cholesterol esterase n=1 Tax=Streptomyces boluensis TaxID=1775135 RepID=A0A964UWN8_9ACTN|nr:cholesterol esterase [Streptomyces boluensis]